MTDAARPISPSGPLRSIIVSASASEPLPDTGRSKIIEISSSGTPMKLKAGANTLWKKSIAPEDTIASIPIKIAMIKGNISIAVCMPPFAPSMNCS